MQIWINLIQNAIKFTPPGGTLMVRMEVLSHEAVVSVADTGIGMDEEQQKRIFEKFYSRTSDPALGGNVKSRPDEGSCFTVRLPMET